MYINVIKYIITAMTDECKFNCGFCTYTTLRKFNLDRHEINKHSKEIICNMTKNNKKELVETNEIIENEIIEKDIIENKPEYKCEKCNKIYLTYRSFTNHKKICNSLNILQCSQCKKSFSSYQSKSNHIKRNTCKPVIVENNMIYVDKRILEDKDNKIKSLERTLEKKQHSRTNYKDSNVIYMLTTKNYKEQRIYIIGKTQNLKNRLSVYNKTIDHEVVYYKECHNKDTMNTIEKYILCILDDYREVMNRDRFILPKNKDISFFTSIIDKSIQDINNCKTSIMKV